MKTKQITLISLKGLLFVGALMLNSSCKKEGCTNSAATNYDEDADEDDGSCTLPAVVDNGGGTDDNGGGDNGGGTDDSGGGDNNYDVPETYVFTDAAGNNTVSFSGQKERLDMLSEMATYMKTGNTAGTALDVAKLKDMYANANNYTWADANGLGMTGSSKQLKSKTAGGDAGVQATFEEYLDSLGAISSRTVANQEDGASGVGGVYPNDGSKGPYLMAANGVEYMQLVEKGLMCAVFMNQMTQNYLANIGDDDNEAISDAGAGKHYTSMEHHWDEAYGYYTSQVDFPASGTDRFWGKYSNKREGVLESNTKIATAFRKGRAAISNKDYAVRDAQVKIINTEIEKVCAGTAIHYLNAAKAGIGDGTARNHQLSEAWAFIGGLEYGANSINGNSISKADIDAAYGHIGTDFNAVTVAGIQAAIDLIASKTDLTAKKGDL